MNPDSLRISPFGGAPSLESVFIFNNFTEDEYTKTELEDEILKPILKVLNYKIQKTIAGLLNQILKVFLLLNQKTKNFFAPKSKD